MKKFLVISSTVLFLLVSIPTLIYIFLFSLVRKPISYDTNTPIMVVSDEVASPEEIVNQIYADGYIQNNYTYEFLLYLSKFIGVRAGAYTLNKGMSLFEIAQNLANPYMRYVKIAEGKRKEEIADQFGKTLGWSDQDRQQFMNVETESNLKVSDGYYFPETYLVPVDSDGKEVATTMVDRFNEQIVDHYAKSPKNIRNLDTVLTIASIIQREAAGKSDMKLISGIIWNRLFNGMALQVDATVQYAKGTQEKWWPRVSIDDIKTLDSPYNTYLNKGIPPGPISNPGLAAIDAAFNPQKTSCLFYLHDRTRNIHCSQTGAEHIEKVNLYLK